jgi:hypothetical protein
MDIYVIRPGFRGSACITEDNDEVLVFEGEIVRKGDESMDLFLCLR